MISNELLSAFESTIDFDPLLVIQARKEEDLPTDYFDFYHSVSSVYSSKIEGENIYFDS